MQLHWQHPGVFVYNYVACHIFMSPLKHGTHIGIMTVVVVRGVTLLVSNQ